MDEEVKKNEITSCPTCGHPVVVRGSITRYFVPISDEKIKELENDPTSGKRADDGEMPVLR